MKAVTTFVFILVCTLSSPVCAQQAATATLGGRILDPNGAVIPGAAVVATQKATGIKRETTTNDEGLFVISNLAAGEYELRAKAQNFAERVYPVVTLHVGQTTTFNIPLEVAATTITIDEEFGRENPIDISASVVDGVINSREIDSLPLNGRNFLELALLIPGNALAPNFDPTKTNTVVILRQANSGAAAM